MMNIETVEEKAAELVSASEAVEEAKKAWDRAMKEMESAVLEFRKVVETDSAVIVSGHAAAIKVAYLITSASSATRKSP